ncbi:MAG: tetratricopeptide repeat protein [Candidatus Zixiibacteriota bacterium]
MVRVLVGFCVGFCLLASSCSPTQREQTSEGEELTTGSSLLAQGDDLFKDRKYTEATEKYLQAASTAEKEGAEVVHVEALSQVARGYLAQDKKEEGRPWLQKAKALASPRQPEGWSRYLGVRGRFEWKDDELKAATVTFKEMYDYCLKNELHTRAVDAAHMVAITAGHEEQIVWARKGIEAVEAGNIDGWLGPLWNNLGWTYDEMGQFQESLEALTKAREYHYKVGDEHAKLVADWSVGHAYRKLGELDAALEWLRPVLARAEKRYAADRNPDTAEWVGHSCKELGEIAVAQGKLEEGLKYLERARDELTVAKMPEWDPEGFKKLSDRIAEITERMDR